MISSSHEQHPAPAVVVLLVDKAGLIRDSLAELLQLNAAGFRIRCVDSSLDLASAPAMEKPNVVLLDIGRMSLADAPVQSDIQLCKEAFPDCRVMIMCEQERQTEALEAVRSGLCGYFPGSLGLDMLIAGVRLIAAGGIFLPPRALEEMPHIMKSIRPSRIRAEAVAAPFLDPFRRERMTRESGAAPDANVLRRK